MRIKRRAPTFRLPAQRGVKRMMKRIMQRIGWLEIASGIGSAGIGYIAFFSKSSTVNVWIAERVTDPVMNGYGVTCFVLAMYTIIHGLFFGSMNANSLRAANLPFIGYAFSVAWFTLETGRVFNSVPLVVTLLLYVFITIQQRKEKDAYKAASIRLRDENKVLRSENEAKQGG